ncbi:MAG: hypothetical protein V8T01_05530 [Oscillospiraceae bacterium]
MKFNLAYVPETDGIKVDQFGTRLNGVEFDLYAAKANPDTSSSERYVIDTSKGADGLLATGTTDSGGRFVLNDDTGGHISLNELTDKHNVEYLILQERPEGREGYRRDENIYLVLTSNDTVSILFNDMEHRWTTGTYAGLKGTVSTSESVQLVDANRNPLGQRAHTPTKTATCLSPQTARPILPPAARSSPSSCAVWTTSARAFHTTAIRGASSPAAPCPAGGYMSAGPVRRAIVRP